MKLWLLWLMVLSPAMAQGTVYKLKVTDWSCSVVGSRIVAKGKVLNQSGVPMRAVRVNLRVVDRVVSRVNGVANRTVRGTSSYRRAPPGEWGLERLRGSGQAHYPAECDGQQQAELRLPNLVP